MCDPSLLLPTVEIKEWSLCVYVIAECPFEIISVRYSRSIRDERNSTDTRQPRRKASQKWIQHAKRKRVSTKMPATTSQS